LSVYRNETNKLTSPTYAFELNHVAVVRDTTDSLCGAIFKRLATVRASGVFTDVTISPCPVVALMVKKELESGGLWCDVKITERRDSWRITTIVPPAAADNIILTREEVIALL